MENNYSQLSTEDLLKLREKTVKNISKYDNYQMAIKIRLNSLYGAMGNQYFRYYKLENAEAITYSGQVSIRWIENKLNEYMNSLLESKNRDFVIALDTDSIYLNMGPLIDKLYEGKVQNEKQIINLIDRFSKEKIEPYIDKSYQELSDYLNAYEQKMHMKREVIANRGIWTAKKKYILNVWDSEGVRYESPKLKMMGIETVKSSTPAICRKMLKDAISIIMTKDEDSVINFIEDFRRKFYTLSPEEIATPTSVSIISKFRGVDKMYVKSTPIHVRGAILYNYHLKKYNLTNKYSLINNGEKIKYIYLREPNPIRENVISFISEIPKEFGLDKYLDYDVQFEKVFLNPLDMILKVIGWKSKKIQTISSIFD